MAQINTIRFIVSVSFPFSILEHDIVQSILSVDFLLICLNEMKFKVTQVKKVSEGKPVALRLDSDFKLFILVILTRLSLLEREK